MPVVTERDGEVRVFTFKEGVLSAVAHDLEIAVERFRFEWDDARTRVTATFDAKSLRVLHAIVRGAPSSALSDRDKRKIEDNLRDDVLHVKRFPEIRFQSTRIDGLRVEGTLTLHGTTRAIATELRQEGGKLIADVPLNQPDFGITPYSAMLGTLRVQAGVRVKIVVSSNG
ncbi:MAG: YceI family protein [Deltaproteobacteria bacterium]|nr:YceI family protein [Deltaproteobacteria bacterium]